MCGVCGCGQTEDEAIHKHDLNGHSHDHSHHHDHLIQHSAGDGAADLSRGRLIEIEKSLLSKNDRFAEANRRRLADQGVFALNLVSSPGAGKTTLLVETVTALGRAVSVGVIEGDQETANDAERIRATGVAAVQINTGRGCHLDAHMIGHALDDLSLSPGGVLFIENVGNLVCPAAFDLGEAAKVVILSVTEGDDKPLKYPDMFAAARLMVLSKIDLLPHVDFDPDKAIERARRVNPQLQTLQLSVRSGAGMADWLGWIAGGRDRVAEPARPDGARTPEGLAKHA